MAFGTYEKKMKDGKSMMDNWIAHERQLGFDTRLRAIGPRIHPQVLAKV